MGGKGGIRADYRVLQNNSPTENKYKQYRCITKKLT